MIVPTGFGYYTAKFIAGTGIDNECDNTWAFQNAVPYSSPSVALAAIHTLFTASGRLYNPARYASSWYLESEYLLMNIGGVLMSAVSTVHAIGGGTWQAPSPNVSAIVRKNTNLAGRQYRGHVSLPSPFLDEDDIDIHGGFTSSTLQTAAEATRVAMSGANLVLALLHAPPKVGATPAPTGVSSLSVPSVVGTVRKRVKR